MDIQLSKLNTGSKISCFLSLVHASFLLILWLGLVTEAANQSTNIGAIIDINSRAGKEQKTAMIMALQNFNNNSRNHGLIIHFRNTSRDPVQTISTAEELIGVKRVQAIVGMQTWEEAALVADVGKTAQVPVLSLAADSGRPLLRHLRWPFLVQMATDSQEQINCIAAIVNSYHWRKVIVIREDNSYFTTTGILSMLSQALQNVGTEIEYDMVLPPFSALSDPEGFVRQEVAKLMRKQSRVFMVLESSLPLAMILFTEAKQIGLMGRDSVWILTGSISDHLDSVNPSFISSMQGAIGIKSYYSESTRPFLEFKDQFRKNFRQEYPDEDSLDPGIHALIAYDSITAITEAVQKIGSNSTDYPILLLNEIRLNDFTGLGGEIRFHDGKLGQRSMFKIVNIVGRSYKDLGIWSSKFGFSQSLGDISKEGRGSGIVGADSMNKLSSLVNWPGELDRVPKGWAMPTDAAPMKIGVPGNNSFPLFVQVKRDEETNETKPDGFCIELFEKALKVLEKKYTLPYKFVPFKGSYNDLVESVFNKTFDAAVGDITILANRSKYVEFTQPYTESGLSMLVPVKKEPQRPWIFMMPFTRNMWIFTFAILFYTMFVVWFMEHQSNPEFRGLWKDQLGTALWFTFSSLFFAHREKLNSNYTKLVVVVWLFVVFVLTSSYTASLTSLLTVPRLEPSVTGIDWIRNTNATVGCDGDSFVEDYVRDVIKVQNIKIISSQERYVEEFKSGNISAAFLELPYQKLFLKDHCKKYTVTGPTYNFGGLGFAFQKNSPIARDVSEAILTLMENGELKRLERKWFGSSNICSNSDGTTETESLSLKSFWGLYLVSAATSTLCFLAFVVRLLKSKLKNSEAYVYGAAPIVNTMVSLGQYFHNRRPKSLRRRTTFRWDSSKIELVSPSDPSEIFEASPLSIL